MHPIQNQEKLEKELSKRKISFTKHFEEDTLPARSNVTREMPGKYLRKRFNHLIAFTHKKDRHENERYNLIFEKSSKYYFLLALSFSNGNINIITSFVTRKHRGDPEKLVERWG